MKRYLWLGIGLVTLPLFLSACAPDAGEEGAEAEEEVSPETAAVSRIPVVPVGVPLSDELDLPPDPEVALHPTVNGAADHVYQVENGRIVVTTWQNRVHRVIYQTPFRRDTILQAARNRRILDEYAGVGSWDKGTETESGIRYRRSDGRLYAFWATPVDYLTVQTRTFREAVGEG